MNIAFIDSILSLSKTFFAALLRRGDRVLNKKSESALVHIGVLCSGTVGELLLTSGLLSGIKRHYPESETILFTSTDNASACELIPHVDVVYSIPEDKSLYVIKMLRRSNLDMLIDTSLFPAKTAFLSALSKAKLTTGFAIGGGSFLYDKAYPYRNDMHIWKNYASLLGKEIPDIALRLNDPGEIVSRLVPKRDFVMCHMFGQGRYAKLCEWEPEKWEELTRYISAKKLSVVFTGSVHEQNLVDDFINKYLPDTSFLLNLSGRLTLEEAAQLSIKAKAVVSVCSGFMHLASLAGAYTVGLFGPVDPVRWGAVGPNSVTLTPAGVSAFPVLKGAVKEHPSCAKYIEVTAVKQALEKVLTSSK